MTDYTELFQRRLRFGHYDDQDHMHGRDCRITRRYTIVRNVLTDKPFLLTTSIACIGVIGMKYREIDEQGKRNISTILYNYYFNFDLDVLIYTAIGILLIFIGVDIDYVVGIYLIFMAYVTMHHMVNKNTNILFQKMYNDVQIVVFNA